MTTQPTIRQRARLPAVLLFGALLAQSACSEASVDLIAAGIGSWVSIPAQRRFQDETYYSYMEYRWGTVAMNAKVGHGPNVAKSPDTGGDFDLAGSALDLSLSVSIYP
jgi:hypothetical protein